MLQTLQLPLHLGLRDDALFDNFFVGENAQVMAALKALHEQFILCYGETGSGRTHLLQAVCHHFENDKKIFYLPLSEHASFSPDIFDALETQDIVCIDDVDTIAGDSTWEEALFHFYNRARDNHAHLLLSATKPPQQINITLPDLKSRLSAALSLEIKSLKDHDKIAALQLRATARGLTLSNEVVNYLLHHHSRNMRDLMQLLTTCDEISLITKRKLTIPFVKKILALLENND